MLADEPFCARRGDEWWWNGERAACPELATVDDHVIALAFGGELDDPANHQGLCADCHGVKSRAESAAGRATGEGGSNL